MKLKPAMMFEEHMILQQNKTIPVWGTSASNDEISVFLNGVTKKTNTKNGDWYVEFEPMQATNKTKPK